jgi:N-acetylglutamate synthase-like GNAT family acetyltransferase
VKRATEQDVVSIASLLRQAFAEYEPHYTSDAFAATVPRPEELLARWEEGPVWVVLRDGDIVGTVGAVGNERGVYVRSMAFAPNARGAGLGGARDA